MNQQEKVEWKLQVFEDTHDQYMASGKVIEKVDAAKQQVRNLIN